MRVLVVNGNKIEIDLLSLFSGKETVYYNGEIVSQMKSLWGGVHAFNVKENGVETQYEIKVGMGFPIRATVVISRNGELLYADNNLKNQHGIQM
jgi:hypothetical protein